MLGAKLSLASRDQSLRTTKRGGNDNVCIVSQIYNMDGSGGEVSVTQLLTLRVSVATGVRFCNR
jgi:hypothetical protein